MPYQCETYGFDARRLHLGPKGLFKIKRNSRDASELHAHVLSFAVSPMTCVTEGKHEDLKRHEAVV